MRSSFGAVFLLSWAFAAGGVAVAAAGCSSGASSASSSGDASDGGFGTSGDASDGGFGKSDGTLSTPPSPDGCIDDASAGLHVFSCDGMAVTVNVPAACVTRPCGVVLDVHGLFIGVDATEANTKLRTLGEAAGYIVVQPEAPTRTPQGPVWLNTDDDAVFAALERVVRVWRVDAKRIHVTGFSQGGYVTWRLVCKHADVIASAAPGAAGTASCPSGNLNTTCDFAGASTPSQKIDILFLAGRRDAIVPFECTTKQRDAVIAAWQLGPAEQLAGDASWARTRRTAPGGEATFEMIEHDYVTDPSGRLASNEGHCFPGAAPASGTIWDDIACKPPNAFTWGEEVMKFFVAHPKR